MPVLSSQRSLVFCSCCSRIESLEKLWFTVSATATKLKVTALPTFILTFSSGNLALKVSVYSVFFLARKSHSGRLTIGWQAAAPASQ